MFSFKDSQEYTLRRLVRGAVRKSLLTRAERDVTLALVNVWFHHRHGPKGYIHPGCQALAKKANVSSKTVSRTFGKLRAAGVLETLSNLKGGQATATRYKINLAALMTLCGAVWIDAFLQGRTAQQAPSAPAILPPMSWKAGDKMSHCITDVATGPCQSGRDAVGAATDAACSGEDTP